MANTLEPFSIRRWITHIDETLANEAGVPADGKTLRKIVIGAVIRNPALQRAHTESLMDIVEATPALGAEFGRRFQEALGGEAVASYGKGCVVGVLGEYEHGNAFLTDVCANPVRQAFGGGKSWFPSTGKRGGPGTTIDIPLAHRNALYVRANYDTATVTFADGPNPDEVLILFAVATRGRLHARLGGLTEDKVKGEDGLR